MIKLQSYRIKEELIRIAWQRGGFTYESKRVFLDNDYAPEILKRRKEYTEVKRVWKKKRYDSRHRSQQDYRCFRTGRPASITRQRRRLRTWQPVVFTLRSSSRWRTGRNRSNEPGSSAVQRRRREQRCRVRILASDRSFKSSGEFKTSNA